MRREGTMAEVLVQFDTIVTTSDGRAYRARACGRAAGEGLWEGWLEFLPLVGASVPLRTGRETTQPNRADLLYWAGGLTQVYIEGALERAMSEPVVVPSEPVAVPAFSGPRPPETPAPGAPAPRAVLNPYEVYAQGADVLRGQLDALSAAHLRAIALAYNMASPAVAAAASRDELTTIVLTESQRVVAGAVPPRGIT
jgi:hypothetical protein